MGLVHAETKRKREKNQIRRLFEGETQGAREPYLRACPQARDAQGREAREELEIYLPDLRTHCR